MGEEKFSEGNIWMRRTIFILRLVPRSITPHVLLLLMLLLLLLLPTKHLIEEAKLRTRRPAEHPKKRHKHRVELHFGVLGVYRGLRRRGRGSKRGMRR